MVPPESPSFADDPAFRASLSSLDRTVPPAEPQRASGAAPGSSASRRRPLLELSPVEGAGIRSAPPTPYELFYGLEERAFDASSDSRFYYRSASHSRALGSLADAIRRRDGVVLLTGAPGLGKTTICRALVEQLDRQTIASLVAHPFLPIEELLKTVLVDFGVIAECDLTSGYLAGASDVELVGAFHHFLCSLAPLGACAVVIIDDAQTISLDVLDRIREISDLERDARLLQVILVGRPDLADTLARPECESLSRRIGARAEVVPLTRADLDGYVQHRLAVAGTRATASFGDEARGRLHDLSGGVPRTLNKLCDRALKYGHQASARVIDRVIVDRAGAALGLVSHRAGHPAWQKTAIASGLALLALFGALAAFAFRAWLWTLLD